MPKKQRLTVESGLRSPEVTPSFPRFNDSYVPGAAARGARSQLDQLASGLSEFNRGVTPFLAGLRDKQNKKDEAEGTRKQQSGEDLPPEANEWETAGFNREAGYAVANAANNATNAELNARREDGQSVTAEDYTELYQQNIEAGMAELDPRMTEDDEFQNAMWDLATNLQRGETSNLARAQKDSDATTRMATYRNNTTEFVLLDFNEELTDEEIMEGINERQQDIIKLGAPPRDATKATIDALTLLAEEGDRFGLSLGARRRALKLAGEVDLAEGKAKFSKKYGDEFGEIHNALNREEDDELGKTNSEVNFKAQQAYDEVNAEYLEITESSPNIFISEEQWNAWEQKASEEGGPRARDLVRAQRRTHGKGYDDPQTIANIQDRFMAGEITTELALAEIQQARVSGKITVSSSTAMREEIEGFGPEGIKNSDLGFYETELSKIYVPLDYGKELTDEQREMFRDARAAMYNHLRQPEVWEVYRSGSAATRRALERAAFENARMIVGEPTFED